MNINFISIIALLVAIGLMIFLWKLGKKNISFGLRTIIAMFLGIVLGVIFKGNTEYIAPFGKIYVNLITAVVVPLLFSSVFLSICSLKDITKLKSIGLRAVFWLISSTIIAATVAFFIGNIFNVGDGLDISSINDYTASEVPSFLDTIINLFPKNIISDASNNNIIAIIIFSILLGIAELFVSSENSDITKPFKNIVKSFLSIINMVVCILVELTPYAVLSLIANAISNSSISKLIPLLNILFASYLSCLIVLFIVFGALILFVAKLNPIKFFKKIWTAIVLGFTSQSSVGTVPVNIECLTKKVGVSENVASFVAPLGATMGMPGCSGIWPVILAITAINCFDISYTAFDYVFLIILTGVVSLGTVGVPGTATISATAVFASAGLPIEIIVITTPISVIVDMIRTATNVTCAATSTVLVAKSQNEVDMDIFNS